MINELIGNKIILRKAKPTDLDDIYNNVYKNQNLFNYMFLNSCSTYSQAKIRLEKTIEYQKNNYQYFVVDKNTNEVIGFAGVKEEKEGIFEETGICICEKYQGRGIGKEILFILLDLVFNKLNKEKFIYAAMEENNISKKLCLSFGFKYIETKKELREFDNKICNVEYYELNKSEYQI